MKKTNMLVLKLFETIEHFFVEYIEIAEFLQSPSLRVCLGVCLGLLGTEKMPN